MIAALAESSAEVVMNWFQNNADKNLPESTRRIILDSLTMAVGQIDNPSKDWFGIFHSAWMLLFGEEYTERLPYRWHNYLTRAWRSEAANLAAIFYEMHTDLMPIESAVMVKALGEIDCGAQAIHPDILAALNLARQSPYPAVIAAARTAIASYYDFFRQQQSLRTEQFKGWIWKDAENYNAAFGTYELTFKLLDGKWACSKVMSRLEETLMTGEFATGIVAGELVAHWNQLPPDLAQLIELKVMAFGG